MKKIVYIFLGLAALKFLSASGSTSAIDNSPAAINARIAAQNNLFWAQMPSFQPSALPISSDISFTDTSIAGAITGSGDTGGLGITGSD
jgi:hypothetical protein